MTFVNFKNFLINEVARFKWIILFLFLLELFEQLFSFLVAIFNWRDTCINNYNCFVYIIEHLFELQKVSDWEKATNDVINNVSRHIWSCYDRSCKHTHTHQFSKADSIIDKTNSNATTYNDEHKCYWQHDSIVFDICINKLVCSNAKEHHSCHTKHFDQPFSVAIMSLNLFYVKHENSFPPVKINNHKVAIDYSKILLEWQVQKQIHEDWYTHQNYIDHPLIWIFKRCNYIFEFQAYI